MGSDMCIRDSLRTVHRTAARTAAETTQTTKIGCIPVHTGMEGEGYRLKTVAFSVVYLLLIQLPEQEITIILPGFF